MLSNLTVLLISTFNHFLGVLYIKIGGSPAKKAHSPKVHQGISLFCTFWNLLNYTNHGFITL